MTKRIQYAIALRLRALSVWVGRLADHFSPSVSIYMEDMGPTKIRPIKLVRDVSNLGLVAAKKLVDTLQIEGKEIHIWTGSPEQATKKLEEFTRIAPQAKYEIRKN